MICFFEYIPQATAPSCGSCKMCTSIWLQLLCSAIEIYHLVISIMYCHSLVREVQISNILFKLNIQYIILKLCGTWLFKSYFCGLLCLRNWQKVSFAFYLPSPPPSSWLTPFLAQSSSSLGGLSPVLLTCFLGAAAVRAFTRRATGGRHPLRVCLAWRDYSKLGPWLTFHKAPLLSVDLKDHLTPMSL